MQSEDGERPIETYVLDDALWERILELTQGAAAPCFQCGVCTASCPWGLVRDQPFSVRRILHEAQLGLLDGDSALWLCTACGQCEGTCPRGVPIASVLQNLRYILWERRLDLQALPSVLWSLYWNGNPWWQPPSQRAGWAADLNLPSFDSQAHDILLYIGCTPSYDRRAQNIARALVRVFRAAGVTFGILGEHEPCCGEAALSLGHMPYFEELASAAAQVFEQRGVQRLVAISPHCYDAFRNHHNGMGERIQILHYTQFLHQLVDQGRLRFPRAVDLEVTFHDPCYLGRWNGEFAAPRRVLESIDGVRLSEMERHGDDALCCGGGGGRMWMETPADERFSDLRVQEALATGASVIATACPFCVSCLEDSLKGQRLKDLRVMDVAEIAAHSLDQAD